MEIIGTLERRDDCDKTANGLPTPNHLSENGSRRLEGSMRMYPFRG
jgi:hypothetical protein